MFKFFSSCADKIIRSQAHRQVNAMEAPQVRQVIHKRAPVMGRIYTACTRAETQRDRLHKAIREMSPAELRQTAMGSMRAPILKILGLMD